MFLKHRCPQKQQNWFKANIENFILDHVFWNVHDRALNFIMFIPVFGIHEPCDKTMKTFPMVPWSYFGLWPHSRSNLQSFNEVYIFWNTDNAALIFSHLWCLWQILSCGTVSWPSTPPLTYTCTSRSKWKVTCYLVPYLPMYMYWLFNVHCWIFTHSIISFWDVPSNHTKLLPQPCQPSHLTYIVLQICCNAGNQFT